MNKKRTLSLFGFLSLLISLSQAQSPDSARATGLGATTPPPPPTLVAAAEADGFQGVTVIPGRAVSNFDPGDHIRVDGVDLRSGYKNFAVNLASAYEGSFEVRNGAADGEVLATFSYDGTGGWRVGAWFGGLLPARSDASASVYLIQVTGNVNVFDIYFGHEEAGTPPPLPPQDNDPTDWVTQEYAQRASVSSSASLAGPGPNKSLYVPPAIGKTGCTANSWDCNVCVPNVESAALNLRPWGDLMGVRMGNVDDVICYNCEIPAPHIQGIVRLNGSKSQYLAISISDFPPGPWLENIYHSDLMWVGKLGTRSTSGERWRSNRLVYDKKPANVVPSSSDTLLYTYSENTPDYDHAGGMQVLGRYLAVAIEDHNYSVPAQVRILNMNNPTAPTLAKTQTYFRNKMGYVALTKLSTGQFLMAVSEDTMVDFYVSATSSISSQFQYVNGMKWSDMSKWEHGGEDDHRNYQSLNFVTQCNGTIYAIGTHGSSVWGKDEIDVLRLRRRYKNGRYQYDFYIEQEDIHIKCGDECNFAAGGGTYVSPKGELIIYGAPHDNDGPSYSGPDSIEFREFRSEVKANPNCGTSTSQAYVEFFWDRNNPTGRSVILDYADRYKVRTYNFSDVWDLSGSKDFHDEASEVRVCIPPGRKLRIYKDRYYKGSYWDLTGDNYYDLHDFGWGDKISSARWY